jgi:hypothetical protein
MTDCREPTTLQQGKCCRDPDYVDPWPVGQTGQYVPEELNAAFDSGAYKPEPTRNDPISVPPPQPEYAPSATNQQGYVIPQPSNPNRLYLPPGNFL